MKIIKIIFLLPLTMGIIWGVAPGPSLEIQDTQPKDKIWTEEERQEIIKELQKELEESKKELENLAKNGSYFGLECECDKEEIANIGLIFYNQHYFGDSQKHGIRVSTHMILYADENNEFSKKPSSMTLGIDLKYLYDFAKVRDFTFGLNLGLGYQKSFVFDSEKYEAAKTIYESQKAISELKYNLVNVAGLHIRYHFYQLEILSGYPNYLKITLAYRY